MANPRPTSPVPEGQNANVPASRTTARTTSKLRDSCQACALSKVKCHKEKPVCSRCAKRGIPCDYFITKRPGRKRNNSHQVDNEANDKSNEPPASPGMQGMWNGSANSTTNDLSHVSRRSSNMFGTDMSGSFNVSGPEYPSSSSVISAASDTMFDLSMPLDSSSLSSMLAGINDEFDHVFNSAIGFSDLEGLENYNSTQKHPDIAKLLIPEDNVQNSPLTKLSFGHSNLTSLSPSSWNSQTSADENVNLSSAPQITCFCLMEALDILKSLSSSKASSDIPSTSWSSLDSISDSMAQSVVKENKQAIETVSTMLQCSCMKDGYLLTILSMTMFKILRRYTEAVRKRSLEAIEGHWSNIKSADHDNIGRFSAQSILGELHGVRRLINLLLPRLKFNEGEIGGINGMALGRGNYQRDSNSASFSRNGATAAPFSTTILDQIGTDLHKALRASSLEIITILRRT